MGTRKWCTKGSKNCVRCAKANNRASAPVGRRSSNAAVPQLISNGACDVEDVSTKFFLHQYRRKRCTFDTTTVDVARGFWCAPARYEVVKCFCNRGIGRWLKTGIRDAVIVCDKHPTHHRVETEAFGSAQLGWSFCYQESTFEKSSRAAVRPTGPNRKLRFEKHRTFRRIS